VQEAADLAGEPIRTPGLALGPDPIYLSLGDTNTDLAVAILRRTAGA